MSCEVYGLHVGEVCMGELWAAWVSCVGSVSEL